MINMPKFGFFTNVVILLNGFGTATSLLIASSDFILALFKNLLSDDYTGIFVDKRFWITVIIIIIVPIVFRKTLTAMRFFSLFSIFSISYFTMAIIYSYFAYRQREPSKNGVAPSDTIPSSSEPSGLLEELFKKFMASSIIVFAYGCQQNILPLYSELKPSLRPHIASVIYNAVFFCTFVYLVIGYCGYATFGDQVQSNILNNFDNSNKLINVARFAMAIYCTFSYSVQMHPCRDAIKKEIISYKIRHQKDYGDINEQGPASEEKVNLLMDDKNQPHYGSTSAESPISEASSSNSSNQNNNHSPGGSNTSTSSNSTNSNTNTNNTNEYDDEEDEFESQLDANDADDERSSDSHGQQIKHINIDILDNLVCPSNPSITTINNYDTESLFNGVTLGLLISSYLFAITCDDFGKVIKRK